MKLKLLLKRHYCCKIIQDQSGCDKEALKITPVCKNLYHNAVTDSD